MDHYEYLEVCPGLYRIGSRLGPRYVYQYLLVDSDGSLLVDTGMPETPAQAILPFLKEIGHDLNKLTTVIISHADVDHFSGIDELRRNCRALSVMAHELDTPWIESKELILKERYFSYESFGVSHSPEDKVWFESNIKPGRVDVQLKGGEALRIGENRIIDILHIPGHSEGHLALYDRKNKAAVIIDGILWKGLFDMEGKVISPPPYYSIKPYIHSIDQVLRLDIDYLLTGHYDVMQKENAYRFLHESKEFVNTVGESILHIIENSSVPLSLDTILQETNKLVGPYTVMAVELVGPVYAHLKELEEEKKIHRFTQESIPYWHGTHYIGKD